MPLYRATTALQGEAAARALRDALDALDPAPLASELHDHDDGSGLWDAGGLFDGPPDVAGLALLARLHGAPDFAVARVEDRDWVAQVRAELTPVAAGRFVVFGSHDRARIAAEPDRPRDRGGAGLRHRASRHDPGLPDRARPAGARGACVARRVADIGGGTGVLAMAAAAVWPARGDRRRHRPAGDRDRAGERRRRTASPARVACVTAAGFRHPRLQARRALRPHLRQHPRRAAAAAGAGARARTRRRAASRSCRASWRGRPPA